MSAAETPLLCLIASHFISFLNKHITLIGTQVRINTANSAIADITLLDEFENEWGSISNNRNMIHFLLKYRWKVNWKREVHENYFPISSNLLIQMFNDGFNVDYFERFRVPFLDKCLKEDYNIELTDYTHIKAIFTKKL